MLRNLAMSAATMLTMETGLCEVCEEAMQKLVLVVFLCACYSNDGWRDTLAGSRGYLWIYVPGPPGWVGTSESLNFAMILYFRDPREFVMHDEYVMYVGTS
ncbi:hypothetical protein F5X96DRAFT_400979 [Biscogniauxia mediterranea]|nr:hypothetical protein F5X96DRAFT_400979 [Biscogniauxia mediterranea]